MPDIEAIPVQAIVGMKTADDGQNLILQLADTAGTAFHLAIPREQLLAFVDVAALSKEQGDKILKIDPNQRDAFKVETCEMSFQPNKSLVLTLTFGMGGKLSFLLEGDIPPVMLEALRTHFAGIAPAAGQSN